MAMSRGLTQMERDYSNGERDLYSIRGRGYIVAERVIIQKQKWGLLDKEEVEYTGKDMGIIIRKREDSTGEYIGIT